MNLLEVLIPAEPIVSGFAAPRVVSFADPDEPGLHLMLGHVYERTALPEMAAQEFDEAQFLCSRTP